MALPNIKLTGEPQTAVSPRLCTCTGAWMTGPAMFTSKDSWPWFLYLHSHCMTKHWPTIEANFRFNRLRCSTNFMLKFSLHVQASFGAQSFSAQSCSKPNPPDAATSLN